MNPVLFVFFPLVYKQGKNGRKDSINYKIITFNLSVSVRRLKDVYKTKMFIGDLDQPQSNKRI